MIMAAIICEVNSTRILERLLMLIVLCIEQVSGGGVQENSLFPVAREPDRIQSGLLILCYMENHAKLQVNQHCAKCSRLWSRYCQRCNMHQRL